MGDLGAEPSMEDILASIKRVIKEGEAQPPRRAAPRPLPPQQREPEVLELNQPMIPAPAPAPAPISTPAPTVPEPSPEDDRFAGAAAVVAAAAVREDPALADPPAVSTATVAATRGALNSLSRLVVKPDGEGDGTLEGLVREMLRPMLSEWLDRNLPTMVEQLVAREIAKITAGQG